MNELVLLEDLGMIYPKENSKQKRRYGLCQCFCGNKFKASFHNIKRKHTKSCGCSSGQNRINAITTHNLTSHRLYQTWNDMIRRCTNPKSKAYENYGKRGIKVCERWLNVQSFINDMYPSYQEGLTLDRIDNNKGYSKDNCRWTDRKIQNRNTRLLQSNNTTGYRGVSTLKNKNRYRASIVVDRKRIHLGYFNYPIEAAIAYDKYVLENNLEHTTNGVYTKA